jgi:hypothetical protein
MTDASARAAAIPTESAGAEPVIDHGGNASTVEHAAGNSGRQEPHCPACSMPVRSGELRFYERGEFYHAYCRSRQLERAALEQNADGQVPQTGDGAHEGTPPSDPSAAPSMCPICQQASTVVHGRAGVGWYAVDGCACGGFFVAADTLKCRLPRLTTAERADLVATIQGFHAMGRNTWLTTANGGIAGRLVIGIERPSDWS